MTSRELHNIESAEGFDGMWEHTTRHSAMPWPFVRPSEAARIEPATKEGETARLEKQLAEAEADAKRLAAAHAEAEQHADAAAQEAERLRVALQQSRA